jgi:hypothetical protein
VGRFDLGENNGDACGARGKEVLAPCYESRGTLEFLDDGGAAHWLLRHRLSGTAPREPGATVASVDATRCLRLGASGYAEIPGGACAELAPVHGRVTYVHSVLVVEEPGRAGAPATR